MFLFVSIPGTRLIDLFVSISYVFISSFFTLCLFYSFLFRLTLSVYIIKIPGQQSIISHNYILSWNVSMPKKKKKSLSQGLKPFSFLFEYVRLLGNSNSDYTTTVSLAACPKTSRASRPVVAISRTARLITQWLASETLNNETREYPCQLPGTDSLLLNND